MHESLKRIVGPRGEYRDPTRFQSYAFFDLDGTLISDVSVVAFLRFYLESEFPESAESRWVEFHTALSSMRYQGVARDKINAWFYHRYFTGIEIELVRHHAERWVEMRCRDTSFIKAEVFKALQEHREMGTGNVLVTGSFREIADPLAKRFGIDSYICAPLEEIDGRYTGRMTAAPTIGYGKWLAVDRFLTEHDVAPEDCLGYGDDHTDIPLLERLGQPFVIATGSAQLLAHANISGWNVLRA